MLCYALILLSVDLTSPHVKNKMSKREFVKNICQVTFNYFLYFCHHFVYLFDLSRFKNLFDLLLII